MRSRPSRTVKLADELEGLLMPQLLPQLLPSLHSASPLYIVVCCPIRCPQRRKKQERYHVRTISRDSNELRAQLRLANAHVYM